MIVGLFAVSELLSYGGRAGQTVRQSVAIDQLDWKNQTWLGIKDVWTHPVAWIRSSFIGAGVGIIPGLGGTVAAFLSYSIGMHQTKDKLYGRGSPEGIINAETANDAKEGGALLPTVTLGIPGSADMAILLGAFILHGMQPGPALLRDHADMIYALLFGIIISQIVASGLGLVATPYLARLSLLKNSLVAPFVLVLVVLGTFMLRGNMLDVAVALLAGIFGFLLRRYGFPVITVAIGFILGALAERALLQSLMISDGSWLVFVQRPISATLIVLTVLTIAAPLLISWHRSWRVRST
jgi:putative tricarboxylic transport membrane protein